MTEPTGKASPARAAMIDAAERIVAERGLAALTLRQVQIAAKQSNKSAAQYHFGSRDGLITAILEDRTRPVEHRRQQLLDRSPDPTQRELVEAFVIPLAEHILDHPGRAYGRFLAQAMVDPEFAELIRDHLLARGFLAVQERLRASSGLPAEVAAWRVDSLAGYVIGALAAAEARTHTRADSNVAGTPPIPPLTAPALTASLLDACYAILTSPPSTPAQEAHMSVPLPTTPSYRFAPTDPLIIHGPLISPHHPDPAPYRRITVTPAGTTIGAEVGGLTLSGDLDQETLAELRRALLDWKVLFFRDQDIDRDAHREFARLWGELEQHPFFKYTQPGQTAADVTTLAKGMDSAGLENSWHNDVTWNDKPSFGAVLRAVEIPERGGDTLFCDTAAAYDTLPDEIKARIEHLSAEHDWVQAFGNGMPKDAVDMLRPHLPAVQHPVVRVIPETGRRVLFVCSVFTTRILGVSQEESDELLSILYRHVQRPEFQVRLRWQPHTVAFWDNRACQHYAVSDYFPQRRVMDRISIVGDVPVGVPTP